jgi:hypothetical protein
LAIEQPIEFDSKVFGRETVVPIKPEHWVTIKRAYLSKNPELESVFEELESELDIRPPIKVTPKLLEIPEEFKDLMKICERTKNVLLYGPRERVKLGWLIISPNSFCVTIMLNQATKKMALQILKNCKMNSLSL